MRWQQFGGASGDAIGLFSGISYDDDARSLLVCYAQRC
jgi:hypothetical protein